MASTSRKSAAAKSSRGTESTRPPTATTASTAGTRLTAYQNRSERAREAERELARQIVPALAARSYHIPGNNYCQDWAQYFANNHPFFGICCHHRLHPVTLGQRLVVLVGSLAFGLVMTNCIYLYFLYNTDEGVEGEFFSIAVSANVTISGTSRSVNTVSLTNYQAFLWTAGGATHSLFDLSIWYITACACCQAGGTFECLRGCRSLGSYLVMFAVVILAAAASFVVVLRATLESNSVVELTNITSAGLLDDEIQLLDTVKNDSRSFRFLISWCVEFALALFAYNPILGTILFSGILGCFRLPFLGGRPREVRLEEEEAKKGKGIRQSRTEDVDEEAWDRL